MPYPASLIAYAFVKRGIDEGKYVTQMKLQKMVYFAHGYHLAKFKTPLVREVFEAWKFGPVVQSIYSTYKTYGNSEITEINDKRIEKEIESLSDSAKEAINYTWLVTSGLSAYTLSNWTHAVDSPWHKSYMPQAANIPITNEKIKDYFTGLLLTNA